MKFIIPIAALAALLLAGCQPQQVEEGRIPDNLADKKALLREKRDELSRLTEFVNNLEEVVAAQDPDMLSKNLRAVTTAAVERSDFSRYVEIQAAVAADDYISVASEASGRILKLTVEEGDAVRKGQLIAELDPEQLKKQMAELEKSKELASTVYERQKRLWDQNIGSEIQYLEAKNAVERLEKSMETLALQISKAKVYSPASGVVDRLLLQSGELASPGQPILQLLNPAKLKAVADVPESYLRAVKLGERVKVAFPALGEEQEATVSLIGSTIDPANRTFKVEARIRSNNLIKPNLLAIMYIKDKEVLDAVTIPLELVQQEVGGKDFVYILNEEGNKAKAEKVYIKTGYAYQGRVVIDQGLSGGETLIVGGARGLSDQEAVQIKQEG